MQIPWKHKQLIPLLGMVVFVVGISLYFVPTQKSKTILETSSKSINFQFKKSTDWKKYFSSSTLPKGYNYPAYAIGYPNNLYLKKDNEINTGSYNTQDKRLATSWSSDPAIDTDNLKEGFFVTVDVEMNPKTTKGKAFTADDYTSGIIMDCEGTPQIWNFAGFPAVKYICNDKITSAGKPAVIVKYAVLNSGKLFTVRAASLDKNTVDLNYLEQIVNSFRFVQEDSIPSVIGNSIKIKVTNPHYSPNNEGYALFYEYTFTYDRRVDDVINPSENRQGIKIARGTATLSIRIGFDDGQVLYEKIPNPILISNASLSESPIYRVRSIDQAYLTGPPLSDYNYVSYYKENIPGPNECGQGIDPIAACSMGSVGIKEQIIGISCSADSNSVFNCDDIVKSLSVRSIELK